MRIALALFICMAFLTGCPSAPKVKDAGFTEEVLAKDGTKTIRTMTQEAQFNDTIKEVLSRPLFKITCTPTCTFASLEIGQPINGQLKEVFAQPKEAPPELHPAAQVVREIFQPLERVALALGPAGIVGKYMGGAFSDFKDASIAMAGKIQAPAGTSVVISGSNGVGVLGGSGSTSSTSIDSHNVVTTTTTTDNSQQTALSIMCTFAAATGSPMPAYCTQR